jgi:hypothetical protein
MNTLNKILFLCLTVALTTACSELKDDDYYKNSKTDILNNELKIVNESSLDYLNSRSDLSKMTTFLKDDSIFDKLEVKGQLHTLLVVNNDNFTEPEAKNADYIAKSHVSDIAMSPANLTNGTRILMWHGKYINVDIDSLGEEGYIIDHVNFNNAAVKEVIKTNDGYIYVISSMINTPESLYDYINDLDDNYSKFKKLVLESGSKVFDKTNSKAIGINDQGNTVYDSVFIYKSSFFDSKSFDLSSESLTATMLLFSDDVINQAMKVADSTLTSWNMTRNQDTLRRWILKVAFFNKKYTSSQIQTKDTTDLSSIYECQWRTNAQFVDAANPISLSNATVYKVTKLRFPKNLLMYRLKDYFYYYESCTEEQKTNYFDVSNLVYNSCSTEVDAWTPLAGVLPMIFNRVLIYNYADASNDTGFRLDFTPLKRTQNEDGVYSVTPYLIPPGTYRLAMGFVQNQNLSIRVSVLVNDQVVAKSDEIALGSATTYHYDRGSTLNNTYPEGYDPDNYLTYSSKAKNYDTDGGPIITEVNIPDLKGNGAPVQIKLRIENSDLAGTTKMKFHHWCLRPTSNNY